MIRGTWPDDVRLGTLLVPAPPGWKRWFEARGPVLRSGPLALDADPAVLDHLPDLPRQLSGLSLSRLEITDVELATVVARLPRLVWLDLRGTQVTQRGLTTLRRLRRLRNLGLDAGLTWPQANVRVATGSAELVPIDSGDPVPDTAGFHELLAAAVKAHPETGAVTLDEASTRAAVLLDAGRPQQALAVLAPIIATADPATAIVAARAANELVGARTALAALALATPSVDLLAWRSVVLSHLAPARAVSTARAVLREAPTNTTALWAICSAYLNAGQVRLAEQALAQLESRHPDSTDTARLAARLARARRRAGDEMAAWQRVLRIQPDDADALAGLAHAQRDRRPWSRAWVRTLNAAATADVDQHGRSLLAQVTQARRGWARGIGAAVSLFALAIGGVTPGFVGQPIGRALVVGQLAMYLTAGVLWLLTPRSVRQVIRRTDDLTGAHRRPDWRRAVAGLIVAAGALAVPYNRPVDPGCGGRYASPCREVKAPVIQIPDITIPPFVVPSLVVPPPAPPPIVLSP